MSVHSRLYYWLVCDGCDNRFPNEDECPDTGALDKVSDLTEWATEHDWVTAEGEKHYCSECAKLPDHFAAIAAVPKPVHPGGTLDILAELDGGAA